MIEFLLRSVKTSSVSSKFVGDGDNVVVSGETGAEQPVSSSLPDERFCTVKYDGRQSVNSLQIVSKLSAPMWVKICRHRRFWCRMLAGITSSVKRRLVNESLVHQMDCR